MSGLRRSMQPTRPVRLTYDTKVIMVSKKKQKSSEETVLPPKRRKDEGARYYVPKAAFRQSLSE